jgi:hypothetical protein
MFHAVACARSNPPLRCTHSARYRWLTSNCVSTFDIFAVHRAQEQNTHSSVSCRHRKHAERVVSCQWHGRGRRQRKTWR